MVGRNVFAALNLQALRIPREVDRITAAALGLAANRAVAALVGVGVLAGQAERDRAAMAGSFKVHGRLLGQGDC